MAKLDSGLLFTGTLQNLSAYKMRGSNKIILRTKGGASKEKIHTDPVFDLTRRNYTEFGGRSTASKWVLRALQPLKPVADHNLASAINPILKPVQALDTVSVYGRRSVEISKFPELLEGFNMNRGTPLDTLVQNPFSCTVNRETLSAEVKVPALLPGINFMPQTRYPLYQVVVALGIVPDLFYNDALKRYTPIDHVDTVYTQHSGSKWCIVKDGSAPFTLSVQLTDKPKAGAYSLILSAGICYGMVGAGGKTEVVNYQGGGKLLSIS